MKRSEMIKLITEVLEVFKRMNKTDDETKAVALLTALEDAGMQPPAYRLYSLDREWDCYDWEPETLPGITQETIDDALEHIGKKGVCGEMEITE